VGAGSGRHSLQAFRLGAHVAAVDIADAIDLARRNLPTEVLTVQADAERLPFAESAFDLVAAIGVLHHLPDPERARSKFLVERLVAEVDTLYRQLLTRAFAPEARASSARVGL
jgi:2-polyprenyl-3-methyl-5-hydroxy-6-metoxy-1,4-benzoquinol methylase